MLVRVISSAMTDPTAFLQSNKLATLEGATRALESLVATILYLYCELVVSRLDWANQNGRIVVVVDGDSASFPLINNIVDLDSTPISFVSSSVDRVVVILFISSMNILLDLDGSCLLFTVVHGVWLIQSIHSLSR